jgi:hypothetical protein
MCIVCDLGRSPTLEEIKGTALDISWCKKVIEIQVPKGLRTLYCSGCTSLTSLGPLPEGLQTLNCSYCTNLTSLEPLPESLQRLYCIGCTSLTSLGPLPKSLQTLSCSGCTNLTSLGPLPEGLQVLYCSYCTNLTSLEPLPESLQRLYCIGCTSLTSLESLPEILKELYCDNCRVLTQVGPQSVIDNLVDYSPAIWTPSENLENNLKKLVIVQNFCRSFRTRKLLRLSRTKEFCEWFYHPENYGGRWAKMSLRKMVEMST